MNLFLPNNACASSRTCLGIKESASFMMGSLIAFGSKTLIYSLVLECFSLFHISAARANASRLTSQAKDSSA